MRIIICGAGEVGRHTAEVLVDHGHRVTMVDHSLEALDAVSELVDVRSLRGEACHAEVLRESGVEDCDLLVAATDQDETNLLAATIAKRMGATHTVARIHHRAFVDRSHFDYAKLLDVDHLICPELLTALAIARQLRNPGAIAIERFARDKIEMQQYAVPEGSAAVNVKLSALKLPPGVRLATIVHDGQARIPDRDSVLETDDVVTVVGETGQFEVVRKIFDQDVRTVQRIAIMGGTAMAVWLARALRERIFSIRLFETDRARAQALSDKLDHATVIQADPTDPTVFREEHIENCAAFIGVSDSDEHNILGALQAKEMGAPKTVVVIQQPTYLQLLSHVGVDHPYSPRVVAVREVLRLIDDSPVRKLATLAEAVAYVFELNPVGRGSAHGKKLREISLPKSSFVAAIQRGDNVKMPVADDTIEVGDGLIIIGPSDIESRLRELFIGK